MRRRTSNNSPVTRSLDEQRNALSRPETLRRRYDPKTQLTVLASSIPNKRNREEIEEVDSELIGRANRLAGGSQLTIVVVEEKEEEPEEVGKKKKLNRRQARLKKTAWLSRNVDLKRKSKMYTKKSCRLKGYCEQKDYGRPDQKS